MISVVHHAHIQGMQWADWAHYKDKPPVSHYNCHNNNTLSLSLPTLLVFQLLPNTYTEASTCFSTDRHCMNAANSAGNLKKNTQIHS